MIFLKRLLDKMGFPNAMEKFNQIKLLHSKKSFTFAPELTLNYELRDARFYSFIQRFLL